MIVPVGVISGVFVLFTVGVVVKVGAEVECTCGEQEPGMIVKNNIIISVLFLILIHPSIDQIHDSLIK